MMTEPNMMDSSRVLYLLHIAGWQFPELFKGFDATELPEGLPFGAESSPCIPLRMSRFVNLRSFRDNLSTVERKQHNRKVRSWPANPVTV